MKRYRATFGPTTLRFPVYLQFGDEAERILVGSAHQINQKTIRFHASAVAPLVVPSLHGRLYTDCDTLAKQVEAAANLDMAGLQEAEKEDAKQQSKLGS